MEETAVQRLRDENAALRAELSRLQRDDARSAVAASERRLREVLESIDEAVIIVGQDLRILDLNGRVVQMDGRPAAQLIGRDYFDIWPGARSEDLAALFRRVMADQQPRTVRHSYMAAGREAWFEARVFPSGGGVAVFYRDLAWVRETQRRLDDAEADARLAMEAAQLGRFSLDPRTGAIAWDARSRAVFGAPAEGPVTVDMLFRALHPDDRPRVHGLIAAATDPAGPGRYEAEYRVVGLDGGPLRWVAARGRALFENGQCVQMTGVSQDVTQRKRAELDRQESEVRFRAIAEATPFIVFVTDADGRNTYTNPQFSAFTGVASADLLNHGWLAVLHPDDRARARELWSQCVRAGTVYEIEQRFRRSDGAYRWFLCRGIPVRLPAADGSPGPVTQWFGSCADIEDLVRAREVVARDRDQLERLVAERTEALEATLARLREDDARLRALFEHSSECLFLFRVEPDRGPVFLDVNAPGLKVLNRPAAEVIGRTPRDLVGDGPIADDIEMHLAAPLRPDAGPYRYLARRRYAGREQELDAVAVALPGPETERLILVTARDVSEQRALEAALRQSQKMEAVGQLTGGIAHDFNNLLTGIGGSIELMQARVAQGRTEGLDRYADAAMQAVRRAASLTHRLLAFARRQALDPRPADLNRLIAGMEELIRRTVGPEIALRAELAPDLWPTLCDANQLESALLNLCINARDAMTGGGTLTVATRNRNLGPPEAAELGGQPGDYACIVVTDTGAGMAPDVLARAFEPFFTTKPLGQGTGLGLSMLYGFVRQSGGHVRMESTVGRGTTVRIDLPRYSGPEPVVRDEPQPPAAAPRRPAGKVVLVVEDDAAVRTVAAEVVEGLGCTALLAEDGTTAVGILRRGTPVDLLLTDLGLPGMNGRQVAEAARTALPFLPVLFVTGYAHDGVAPGSPPFDNAMLGPGMELLHKPFAVEALAVRLRAMLAG